MRGEADGSERTHDIHSGESAQLERLVPSLEHDVDHDAHFRRHDIVGRGTETCPFLVEGLERMQSTIEQEFQQVTGHEFESLFQMIGKDIVGPVQCLDEGLQSIQFPEKLLSCHTTGIPGTEVKLDLHSCSLSCHEKLCPAYLLTSHFSRSKARCSDCAIDDSIRSM